MSVFTEERDRAQKTGRCMGCGAPTRRFEHKHSRYQHRRHEPYAALCKDPECRRYYQALYFESVQRVARAVVEQSKRVEQVIGDQP